jgi:DNA (cytosine-5)-methyltransferase 1
MNYLSVFSGIEAATVAWHPLAWTPLAFAEVEPFACAVLHAHYPSVRNLGDVKKFAEWPDAVVDVLVGGSPCQSFSVAGLRGGMADPRGSLTLVYLAIVDRYRPRWIVWENVPGVLSADGGEAFGAFVGGLLELGYGVCWRVLDAQYVRVDGLERAVPQRRRRVFVVGCLGDWRRAAAVLFERESLQWDHPPRRQAGKRVAADVAPGIVSSGRGVERAGETRGQDPVIGYVPDIVTQAMSSKWSKQSSGPAGDEVAHLVAIAFDTTQITSKANRSNPQPGDACHPIAAGAHAPAIAFSAKDYGGDAEFDLSPTLRAGGFTNSHANAGVMPAIAFDARQSGVIQYGDNTGPLDTDGHTMAVAFDMRGRDGGSQFEGPHHTANIRAASGGSSKSYVAQNWAVRRLTPGECESLQGFPRGYTAIPKAADGPRYKALGNSMAVNVMRWVGRRIELVEGMS